MWSLSWRRRDPPLSRFPPGASTTKVNIMTGMTLGYVNLPEAGEQVDRAGRRRVLAVDQARDDLAAARRPHHDGAGTLDRWPGHG